MKCSNGMDLLLNYTHLFSLRSRRRTIESRCERIENIREISHVIGTGVSASLRKIGSATQSVDLRTCLKVMLFCTLFFAFCAAAAAAAPQVNTTGNATAFYGNYKVEIKEPPAPAFYEKTPPLRSELPNRHKNEPDSIYRCQDEACEKVESISLPPTPATSNKHSMAWHVEKITEDSTVHLNQAPVSKEMRKEIEKLLLAAENLQNTQLFTGIDRLINRLDILPLIRLVEHCWMIVNENLYNSAYTDSQKPAAIQSWRDLNHRAQFLRVVNIIKVQPQDPNDPVLVTVTQALNNAYRCDFEAAKRAYKGLDLLQASPAIKYGVASHIVNLAHMRFNTPIPVFDPNRPDEINEWTAKTRPYNRLINFFKREEDRLMPEIMKMPSSSGRTKSKSAKQ